MNQVDDLKLIKKHYGENFSHLCRELFSTILESPGKLYELIDKNFSKSTFLFDDIISNNIKEEFKNFIYNQYFDVIEEHTEIVNKTPHELLKEAGYTLYECKTEEDIQSFKKYYSQGEELCTFNGGRIDRCYVFFAVKDNVDEIKREDFLNPQRQDEYGTSVISIQFTKDEANTLSIKNRYNHTVQNPDATFHNNLDNIISGLTESFNREYNLNSKIDNSCFEIPQYVEAKDGKLYKYNFEHNMIFYCPNNIIIDFNEVKVFDKERYIVADNFIFDFKKDDNNRQNITLYDNDISDGFINTFSDIYKMKLECDKNSGNKKIFFDDTIIEINKFNQIIKYDNPSLIVAEDNFMQFSHYLDSINIPNARKIGNSFLQYNYKLREIDLPNVLEIGDNFLGANDTLNKINLPCVKKIGSHFLFRNISLNEIYLPNCIEVGTSFMPSGGNLKNIILPKLEKTGLLFCDHNISVKNLYMPKIKEIPDRFFPNNVELINVDLSSVEKIGHTFCMYNNSLKKLILPNCVEIGGRFLSENSVLKFLYIPKVESIGPNFLIKNNLSYKLYAPSIKTYCSEYNSYLKLDKIGLKYKLYKFFNKSIDNADTNKKM